MVDYVSSDTHYYHKNVIKYCDRPFSNVDEMNEAMIKAHNQVVSPEDTWHFLGDFAFCGASKHAYILGRLNAKKKIIYCGNHDWNWKPEKLLKLGWDEVHLKPVDWEYSGVKFKLCHFPYAPYDHLGIETRYVEHRPPREGHDWLLCEHTHNNWKTMENQINVGVDNWDFKPLSMDEIVEITKTTNPDTSLDNLKNWVNY